MKTLQLALALGLLALPVAAQTGFDLPRLTWPTETTTPATQGCSDPTQIIAPQSCVGQ